MNLKFAIAALALCFSAHAAGPSPSALDLLGKWEGHMEFGKMKFSLLLRIATNSAGRLEVGIDLPEQGQRGMKAGALLFNAPDVRIEIDQFNTVYSGKLNPAGNEITGQFEEGPGGRPTPMVFKRSTEPDVPEPEKTYTFAKGEPRDIRGYWKGELEVGPGMKAPAALNIGRLPNGSFRASVDLPEQGAKDIPASSVAGSGTNPLIKFDGFRSSFNAALNPDGNQLSGWWMHTDGKSNQVVFTRLDTPFQLLPKDISYTPQSAEDPLGYWKGMINAGPQKLHLVFRIGRTRDGTIAGTLASVEQGGREIPMSTGSFTAPNLKLEWKGIRGKFEGELSKDGQTIDGKWEQFGTPMPLKLERTDAKETNRKS